MMSNSIPRGSVASDSYQERVRYYRRQRENARAEKYRREARDKYSNVDFDEALYRFKNKSKTEKMFNDAGHAAKDFVKGFSDRHFSDHLAWYRDDEKGIIGGVCAGIADKMNWDVKNVRIATIISGLIFTVPTVVTYAVASYLLRNKRLAYRGARNEKEFWRTAGTKSYQKDLDAQFDELKEEL